MYTAFLVKKFRFRYDLCIAGWTFGVFFIINEELIWVELP